MPVVRIYARYYRVTPFIFGLTLVLRAAGDIKRMNRGGKRESSTIRTVFQRSLRVG